ncbi:MAG TPA: GTP-binding protein LepA [Nocardioides sp.]|uniref:GTP-binding protein LepA n=1 Tax=uncultured Nocardioides sp. TaxID=198441 RepID=UPI000ECD5FC2|nr:GTP-binding protein LepA [uncultured Nocardioides sp.]HCB03931.1 GTP-binding protein LepA [Nocardioides sp.]HRD62706.1 GTP-binding protein LepA [Nocardioides sp.]HRI97378.1 GTP-binding protein LepA [Nocardioides sp.]HRK46122.1 GTP-binding protein LepA [Nocardioides sp.]
MSRAYAPSAELRLTEHVAKLADEHPPIELDSVDFSVVRPHEFEARFGHVLDYMARVELEVDRNVLELTTLLPDPPEIDRHFYTIWQRQEIHHGLILDRLQVELGRGAADADLDSIGAKLKVLGALAHLGPFQDVCRMLYYLTGMATERSAVLAYNLLHRGTIEMGETAIANTVIGPIKRQEPGHFAFYQLSARSLWAELAGWQRWLVRLMRRMSFAPVGANNSRQKADFGDVMATLGISEDLDDFADQISRVETELLWARDRGLKVPDYVARAFREAVELARERAHLPHLHR